MSQILAEEARRNAPPDDTALVIATLPPDVREEVLLQCDDETLARLPPNIRAEAEAIRARSARRMYDPGRFAFGGAPGGAARARSRDNAILLDGNAFRVVPGAVPDGATGSSGKHASATGTDENNALCTEIVTKHMSLLLKLLHLSSVPKS